MSLVIASVSRGPLLGDAEFQARVVARQATGQDIPEEGNLVAAVDVSSVTATLYDLQTATLVTTLPVSGANFTAVAINDDYWEKDLIGRNFVIGVDGVYFSEVHPYRLVINLTLISGSRTSWGHDHTIESLVPE